MGPAAVVVTFATRAAAASAVPTIQRMLPMESKSNFYTRPAGEPCELLVGAGNYEQSYKWNVVRHRQLAFFLLLIDHEVVDLNQHGLTFFPLHFER
jgi:hypothetical protein